MTDLVVARPDVAADEFRPVFERAQSPKARRAEVAARLEDGLWDEAPDTAFYKYPKLVYHIDEGAVAALTRYYDAAVPDLPC